MKRCFLIGSHDASDDILPVLKTEIERHIIEYDVEEFIVGHYGRFDRKAAYAVHTAKARHPQIMLSLLLPYLRKVEYLNIFDQSIYPDGLESVPKRYAILRANYKMIDCCEYVISYVKYTHGGAYQCLKYAHNKKKNLINLCKG